MFLGGFFSITDLFERQTFLRDRPLRPADTLPSATSFLQGISDLTPSVFDHSPYKQGES